MTPNETKNVALTLIAENKTLAAKQAIFDRQLAVLKTQLEASRISSTRSRIPRTTLSTSTNTPNKTRLQLQQQTHNDNSNSDSTAAATAPPSPLTRARGPTSVADKFRTLVAEKTQSVDEKAVPEAALAASEETVDTLHDSTIAEGNENVALRAKVAVLERQLAGAEQQVENVQDKYAAAWNELQHSRACGPAAEGRDGDGGKMDALEARNADLRDALAYVKSVHLRTVKQYVALQARQVAAETARQEAVARAEAAEADVAWLEEEKEHIATLWCDSNQRVGDLRAEVSELRRSEDDGWEVVLEPWNDPALYMPDGVREEEEEEEEEEVANGGEEDDEEVGEW
ncbi:hypothetical protein B0A49_01767 [Cryomyces minteri]|uniref:Uncharacterized protein n=1 Tax=Cryomyces minteri TaxID=331657 RepID=A0A4U0XTT3_9PEZI|nr:hypothetical protein B0A49_01767 [Cryomyces minteri]